MKNTASSLRIWKTWRTRPARWRILHWQAQQITTLAGLKAEDADAALQQILCEERMATMYIQPEGTAVLPEDDGEEEEA